MYYYKNIQTPSGETVRQIFFWISENKQINFSDVETNLGSERKAYLAWVAEGNTATKYSPE